MGGSEPYPRHAHSEIFNKTEISKKKERVGRTLFFRSSVQAFETPTGFQRPSGGGGDTRLGEDAAVLQRKVHTDEHHLRGGNRGEGCKKPVGKR